MPCEREKIREKSSTTRRGQFQVLSSTPKPAPLVHNFESMHILIFLLTLQVLYGHTAPNTVDDADTEFWDMTISQLDADNLLSSAEEVPSQGAIGLNDAFSSMPSSLIAMEDDSSTMFGESDPSTISLDPSCSSSTTKDQEAMLSNKLRTRRGAFCTNTDNEDSGVNQNPFLAGFDTSWTIIDPDNRRQCAYTYETVCCEGPFFLPERAYDCDPCK